MQQSCWRMFAYSDPPEFLLCALFQSPDPRSEVAGGELEAWGCSKR